MSTRINTNINALNALEVGERHSEPTVRRSIEAGNR